MSYEDDNLDTDFEGEKFPDEPNDLDLDSGLDEDIGDGLSDEEEI